jgi:hypothetical protein
MTIPLGKGVKIKEPSLWLLMLSILDPPCILLRLVPLKAGAPKTGAAHRPRDSELKKNVKKIPMPPPGAATRNAWILKRNKPCPLSTGVRTAPLHKTAYFA